jgi:hypothetical protein
MEAHGDGQCAAASKLIQVAGNLQDGCGGLNAAAGPTAQVTVRSGIRGRHSGHVRRREWAARSGGSTSTASDGTAKPTAWTLGGAPGINSMTATSGTLAESFDLLRQRPSR